MKLDQIKDTFYIVTGPLQVGKTTYQKKLAMKLNTKSVYEYSPAVDASESSWWEKLIEYGIKNNTNVIESHFLYKNIVDAATRTYNKEIKIGTVNQPPSNIKIIFILPSYENYLKRATWKDLDYANKEYSFYAKLTEKFPKSTIIQS